MRSVYQTVPSTQIWLSIADVLVTIPLGILSDSGYRRLVLCLNLCGLSMMYLWILVIGYYGEAFPIKAILMGPLFSLLGGADCVFLSTVAAVVTEIAPDEAQRFVHSHTLVFLL